MIEKKIVITGGGTGGHVFPALAIAAELQQRGFTILYVGTSHGMEAKLVPEKGYRFYTLKTGSVKNQRFFKIVKTLVMLSFAVVWSLRFLAKEKPSAVLGVGGYVSVPICIAAFLLRIPLYLQEQNVSVGIANRFLGKLADKVFLGFEQARKYFSQRKVLVTGNPLREDFFKPTFPSYNPHSQTLLILGGSQGAQAINQAIVSLLPKIQERFPRISILHQTGARDWESTRSAYEKTFSGNWEVLPFISDVAGAYAKAALVVARSGALTVSELIQVGRPAIFVPYPRKGQNDQTANAYLLESQGAAKVVEQGECFSDRLWAALTALFDPQNLAQMSANFSPLRKKNALLLIGDEIEENAASRY